MFYLCILSRWDLNFCVRGTQGRKKGRGREREREREGGRERETEREREEGRARENNKQPIQMTILFSLKASCDT